MPRMSSRTFGTALTLSGVLILTPDALLLRLIDADSWTTLFWRGLLVTAAIVTFYLLRYGSGAVDRFLRMGAPGLAAAFFYTCSTIFFVHAINNTSVANTLVILATAPLFSAILCRVFLKESLMWSTWLAIVISTGGIGLIFLGSLSGGNPAGDLFALLAALSLASQITTVRQARAVDLVPSLAVSGVFMALIVWPFAAPLSPSPDDAAWLGLLGLVVLPLAFGLITVGPRYIPGPEVSLIMLLETFLGPVWVWLVIGETPDTETVIGGILVLSTLLGHAFYTSTRPAAKIIG